jgi:hypothetical protein
MVTRRLKSYVDDEGISARVGNKGFLSEFIRKAGWSGEVTRFASTKIKDRDLWDFDVELSPGNPVELPHCEGVSFKVAGIANQKAKLNLRVVHFGRLDDSDGGRSVATVQGDLSLVLPQVGLIPVGRVANSGGGLSIFDNPTRPVLRERPVGGRPERPFRLTPDANAVLGRKPRFDVGIGSSLLVIDDVRGSVKLTPMLDLRGRIYRLGNTGVLMSFEWLRFECAGGKPRIDFTGGRLWRQGGA